MIRKYFILLGMTSRAWSIFDSDLHRVIKGRDDPARCRDVACVSAILPLENDEYHSLATRDSRVIRHCVFDKWREHNLRTVIIGNTETQRLFDKRCNN